MVGKSIKLNSKTAEANSRKFGSNQQNTHPNINSIKVYYISDSGFTMKFDNSS